MSPSAARRYPRVVILLSIFAALAPAMLGQEVLRRAEARAYFNEAVREMARKSRLDPATENRVRQALRPGLLVPEGALVDARRTEHSVALRLKAGEFGLESHSAGLEILGRPERHYDLQTRRLLSREFVGDIFSIIRRRSIVAEIGPGSSRALDHVELGRYLQDTLRLQDHDQVRDSFDSTHMVEVITLQNDKQLLRLYGGESQPVGRYFFCCLWDPELPIQKTRWSDASGLATPPGNLLEHLAVVTIPAGTTVIVGTVADNFADQFGKLRPGGNTQVFVPNVRASAFQEYQLKGLSPSPSDIIVLSDDRILRFKLKAEK